MLLEQIQLLNNSQLYEDVKILASFALTFSEHNPELFSVGAKYQILCYQANAYYRCEQYKLAEATYRNALQIRKMFVKGKGKSQNAELTSELEVKYCLHECYVRLKQHKEAIQTLEGVNPKQRTCKINLALAKLYQKVCNNDRSAVTAYKEVLRECPLSLSAIQGLLALGVKSQEVEHLVKSFLPLGHSTEWLSIWLKAHGLVTAKDFAGAANMFKMLDNKPLLRDNMDLLGCLGEVQYFNGDFGPATTTLEKMRMIEPLSQQKMDLLAHLYVREHKRAELESLATSLMMITDTTPEPWIAMGYFCYITKKHPRAVYFAQKALSIDARSIEALLLKGSALMELRKTAEANSHFREALRLAPHRFEVYENLIGGYLASHRVRDAMGCAGDMCRQLVSARSLTLYASVLAKEPPNLDKAKGVAEKALKMDSNHIEAVYVLANIHGQQHQFENGIKLLRSHQARHSTCRLHRMLGEFLLRTNDRHGAADHFNAALRIDPTNAKAIEGLSRAEKLEDTNPDRAFRRYDGDSSTDNEDQFPSGTASQPIAGPSYDLEASGSEAGESDLNSDVVGFG